MTVPAKLLAAISTAGGGQVALIVGAGCSFEAPTNLPLAGQCSTDAHRQLVANGVLLEGECSEPWNLSQLADIIKAKSSGNQRVLVNCLPHREFKNATANEGHLIAAALLLEGALTNIVTLNYDLALSDAISRIGVKDEIAVINGPDQHSQLGGKNLIYLHRSVDNDFEDWILTTDALESEWKDAWEETIARHAISAPVTVFAGMGSSCGVINYSADKLRRAVGETAQMILANPGDIANSTFAKELAITEDNYVQLGWIDFMREIGMRYHIEVVSLLQNKMEEIVNREGYIDADGSATEDIPALIKRIEELGILKFGSFRGALLLDHRQFPTLESGHFYAIADLLLGIGCIERHGGVEGVFQQDGHVAFRNETQQEVSVFLVDGSTRNLRWLSLENQIRQYEDVMSINYRIKSRRIVAAGLSGTRPEQATPPISIIGDTGADDILDGEAPFQYWDVQQLREEVASIDILLA